MRLDKAFYLFHTRNSKAYLRIVCQLEQDGLLNLAIDVGVTGWTCFRLLGGFRGVVFFDTR